MKRESPRWRRQRGLFLLLILVSFFPWPDPVLAGQIVGSIDLPPAKASRRSLRGAAYRGRQSASSTPSNAARTDSSRQTRSRFDDVVISAHPVSFVPTVEPLPEPPRMEQIEAQFSPRVVPVTVGSRVLFINRDAFYHNVFSLSSPQKFDHGRKPAGEEVEQVFPEAGVVRVFCDIHPQMSSTILVLDTPYFTQPDSTGQFVLRDLPAGTYALRFFHPKHKAADRRIDVDEGTPVRLQIDFTR